MPLLYSDSFGILDIPGKDKIKFFVDNRFVLEVGVNGFTPKWFNISEEVFLSLSPIVMDVLEKNTLLHILSFRKHICRHIYNKVQKRMILCDPFLTYTVNNVCFIRNFLFSVELNNERYLNFVKSLNKKIEKKGYKTLRGCNNFIERKLEGVTSSCERVVKTLGDYEVKRYFNVLGQDCLDPHPSISTQIEIRNITSKYIKFRIYVNPYKWEGY